MAVFDLIVAGGHVVREDSPEGTPPAQDIAIRGERIVHVAPRIDAPCRRRIDAAGLLVLPGLIDPHIHLSLPMKGTFSSDDPDSGTRAALFGGVTTVIDFTLQAPGQSLAESFAERCAFFAGRAHTDYAFHVNVTSFGPDFEQTLPAAVAELAAKGAITYKVFPCYSRDNLAISPIHLRALLRATRDHAGLVLVHAEDDGILNRTLDRLIASGRTTPRDYPASRPPEAEAAAIASVIEAAHEVDAPIYIVHVSTAAGVQAIRQGRRHSKRAVYLETCPQYLFLDHSAYEGDEAAQFMVAPPLRAPENRAALLDALASGEVDVVATDHCPFRRDQKSRPGASFVEIPNGLPGIETRWPLLYTEAIRSGRFDLRDLVRVAAIGPARIHGLYPRKGSIRPGSDADLVLFDPNARWAIDPAELHMETDFSPYAGRQVEGRVRTVLLRGHVVIDQGSMIARGEGRFLPRPAQ